ncbi:MAG TPA: oxidoreductase [Clostridiales bacterium]|nr:MAG: 3-oxoacyl-(acyl-carrier-protein) reductase FabG [Firmicutes bacterium ADurb.Bin262]HOU10158.1 oxidoreductase [Clostridiales bacterium]HQH63246.1 oxidoreductase [Clostridiales bacterium]HQK72828.1 oxidoreductase [Clostridiales bacterium]
MSKTVLVTGASKGIGFALAKKLLEEGYNVYCAARSLKKMEPLRTLGGKILALDCGSPASIEQCAQTILEESGSVDILVNNAGYGLYGAVENVAMTDGREQMEVNFFAPVYLSQLLLPAMRARGGGRIINISSVAGRVYSPASGWYCASKFALEGITDCMRLELAPFNIRAVLIEPGPVKTDWSDGAKSSLLKNSDGTAYEDFGKRSYKLLSGATGSMAAEPSAVVKAVMKAVNAKNPKPRYLCGRMSRLSVISKKIMGDRLFDKAIGSQMK